ncbi:MAG: V-type ATP synthase subunit F [Clostridiales bacterium]|nr:V-type ATP synthase subunit F [Clostridiales bacterium]
MPSKIAVIGDKDSVLAFKAVGVEVHDATTAEQASNLVKKLSQTGQYAVLLIAEDLAELIPETLTKAKLQTYPAVVPIPTTATPSGFGLSGIKSDVEKAIGVDIIFNKGDK